VESLPSGWVTVRGMSYRRMLLNSNSSVGRLVAWRLIIWSLLFVTLASQWSYDLWGFTAAVAVVCAIIVTLVIGALLVWRRNPSPEINLDTGELRVGRSVVSFDGVTEAQYLGLPSRSGIDWYLRFGAHVTPSAVVVVRSLRLPEATSEEREIVAEMLRRSHVAIPVAPPDPYDPKGKFAWMDHPNNLTLEEAIQYLLHTPESGEPERTPPRPKSIWIDEDD
jgi:hypothetical protein